MYMYMMLVNICVCIHMPIVKVAVSFQVID